MPVLGVSTGGIPMMARGNGQDPDSNYFLYKQMLADALIRGAISEPKQPQLSWTQGASRIAEAALGAYKMNQLENQMKDYQASRSSDMQTLANVLQNGGNLSQAMGQMHNPSTQNMVFQNLMQQNAFNNQLAKMGVMQNFLMTKQLQSQSSQLDNQSFLQKQKGNQELTLKNQEQIAALQKSLAEKQAQADLDKKNNPLQVQQDKYFQFNQMANDPSYPQEQRDQFRQTADQLLGAIHNVQMHNGGLAAGNPMALPGAGGPSSGTSPSGTSITSGTGTGKGGGTQGPDLISAAQKAKDSSSLYKTVMGNIESGNLTDRDLDPAVTATYEAGAKLGSAPAANKLQMIDQYKQLSAISTVKNLTDIGGAFHDQGLQARITGPLIDMAKQTTFAPDEIPSSAYPKMFMQKQLNDRAASLGDVAQQYANTNGSLLNPDKVSGQNFEQMSQNFLNANPALTLQQWKDQNQNNQQQNQGQNPQSNNQDSQQIAPQGQSQPQSQSPNSGNPYSQGSIDLNSLNNVNANASMAMTTPNTGNYVNFGLQNAPNPQNNAQAPTPSQSQNAQNPYQMQLSQPPSYYPTSYQGNIDPKVMAQMLANQQNSNTIYM